MERFPSSIVVRIPKPNEHPPWRRWQGWERRRVSMGQPNIQASDITIVWYHVWGVVIPFLGSHRRFRLPHLRHAPKNPARRCLAVAPKPIALAKI